MLCSGAAIRSWQKRLSGAFDGWSSTRDHLQGEQGEMKMQGCCKQVLAEAPFWGVGWLVQDARPPQGREEGEGSRVLACCAQVLQLGLGRGDAAGHLMDEPALTATQKVSRGKEGVRVLRLGAAIRSWQEQHPLVDVWVKGQGRKPCSTPCIAQARTKQTRGKWVW